MTAPLLLNSAFAKPQEPIFQDVLTSIENQRRTTTLTTIIPYFTLESLTAVFTVSEGRLMKSTATIITTLAATMTLYPGTTSTVNGKMTVLPGQRVESTGHQSFGLPMSSASMLPSSSLQLVTDSERGEKSSSTAAPANSTVNSDDWTRENLDNNFPATTTSTMAWVSSVPTIMMPTKWETAVNSSTTYLQGELPSSSADPINNFTQSLDLVTKTEHSSFPNITALKQNMSSALNVPAPSPSNRLPTVLFLNETTRITSRTVRAVSEFPQRMVKHLMLARTVLPRESMTWSTSPTSLPNQDEGIVSSERKTGRGRINRFGWCLGVLICVTIVAM
ncbi:hypothetical protein FKW77_000985 [Venturia effusa]|uniref:Uncharacterized protein n=1 Tax=Venturia effusa TaxID=50376 RepID=A0A517L6L6_9PEZI|nr:hypothetical protein FKW77_000985 [Venturia effusa]